MNKKDITKEQLGNLKSTQKTSEFFLTFFILTFFSVLIFVLENFKLWSISVTIIISGYILSRAFFKKGRSIFLYSGYQTSEFYFLIIGSVLLLVPVFLKKNTIDFQIINLAIIHFVFFVSRGITKSYRQNQTFHLFSK